MRFSELAPYLASAAAGTTTLVAAQCEQGENQWDSSKNGCIECTPDKKRCQRCAERWVLTAEGQCARVSAGVHCVGMHRSLACQPNINVMQPLLLPPTCSVMPLTSAGGRTRVCLAERTTQLFV